MTVESEENFDASVRHLSEHWHGLVNEGMNEHEASRVADMVDKLAQLDPGQLMAMAEEIEAVYQVLKKLTAFDP